MLNPPRSREYYDKVEQFGIGGHCDQSSLTLLFEQNVAGLQMLTSDGKWKWVKPAHGGITINAGELFKLLTNGYVKATIHRVHAPVDDQINGERLGCLYFALLNVIITNSLIQDDVVVRPAPSPKLIRLGLVTEEELKRPDIDYLTSMEYTRARI
jgi:isopenicillin N synthase-like dioxygenase